MLSTGKRAPCDPDDPFPGDKGLALTFDNDEEFLSVIAIINAVIASFNE